MRSDLIIRALSIKHAEDIFFTEVKTGSTWFADHKRMDAMAMAKSWRKPCITAYEVKISRQDFLRDEKWPAYLNYCNRFYFVCQDGLIQLEQLPENVGLIWYNPETKKLRTKRKALYRSIDIPPDMFMYLLMNRIEPDRHPFFSSKREMLELWVADKSERKKLSANVQSAFAERLNKAYKDAEKAEKAVEKVATIVDIHKKLIKILHENGVTIPAYRWEDKLVDRLSSTLPANMEQLVLSLSTTADQLKRLIGQEKEEVQ